MRFLPFIKGQDFLIVYAVFAIVAVLAISRIIKNNDHKEFVISNLNEDKYYVLKNNYNLYNMFYYITYKLYVKGVLLRDEKEKAFYVNKDISTYLSQLEEQVYVLYLDKFAPKDFKANMVNEIDFKKYYNNIYNELVLEELIKDTKTIEKNKSISNMGIIVMLIPGVWRLIGGIISGMPVSALIFELIITAILYKVILSIQIRYRLTRKGEASKKSYEKYYKLMEGNTESIGNSSGYGMQDFLMTNSWMYFLGISTINTKNNNFTNNSSGGSCSSCSSGSSCSSCGGCGGN